jgi:hypothetical protein
MIMGSGKDKVERKGSEQKFIQRLINDIKKNGIGYIRSPKTVKAVRTMEPDIEFKYSREDDIYTAFYNKGWEQ